MEAGQLRGKGLLGFCNGRKVYMRVWLRSGTTIHTPTRLRTGSCYYRHHHPQPPSSNFSHAAAAAAAAADRFPTVPTLLPPKPTPARSPRLPRPACAFPPQPPMRRVGLPSRGWGCVVLRGGRREERWDRRFEFHPVRRLGWLETHTQTNTSQSLLVLYSPRARDDSTVSTGTRRFLLLLLYLTPQAVAAAAATQTKQQPPRI